MADQDRTSTEQAHVVKPVPVTPSDQTERPEGLAFDVAKNADLHGVPAGSQTSSNPDAGHTEDVVRESGQGVGLAVPAHPGRNQEERPDEEAN